MNNIKPPLDTSLIIIKLDDYEDIFSDFDMRSEDRRGLSIDFLDEIKRASNDKTDDGIEFILNVPENGRDEGREAVIKDRLLAHFVRHRDILQRNKRKVLYRGIIMIILGIISMIGATLVLSHDSNDLLSSFLVIFLEPAAWFLLWEGADQILFNSKNIDPELDFYRKMSDSRGKIEFRGY
jgi:hypothetical protein